MPRDHYGSNRDQSEYYGALQSLVDSLFPDDGDWAPGAGGDASTGAAGSGAEGAADANAGTSGVAAADSGVGAADAAAAFGVSERAASLLGLAALVPAEAAPAAAEPAEAVGPTVRRLDAVLAAEAADLPDDLVRIVKLLPPGDYTRARLCTQLNSALTGHAWGQVYGTVE